MTTNKGESMSVREWLHRLKAAFPGVYVSVRVHMLSHADGTEGVEWDFYTSAWGVETDPNPDVAFRRLVEKSQLAARALLASTSDPRVEATACGGHE